MAGDERDSVRARRSRLWTAVLVGVPVLALWIAGLIVMFGGHISN